MTESSAHRRFWLWLAGTLLILGIALVFAVPSALRLGLEKWLDSQGPISAKIEEIDFNPLAGRLVIHTFLAEREETPGRIEVQRASLILEWWPLWKKHLMLDRVNIRDAVVTVRQSGRWWYVGGMKFNISGGGTWEVGFGDIDLQNVQVRLLLSGGGRKTIEIASVHVDSMQEWNPDFAGTFDVKLRIAGSPVELQGKASPFAASPSLDAHLQITQFPLPWLQPWLQPHQIAVQGGNFSTRLDITGRYEQAEQHFRLFLEGNLQADRLQASRGKNRIRQVSLNWQGKLTMSALTGNRPPLLTADGILSATPLDLQLATPALRVQAGNITFNHTFAMGTKEAPAGSSFVLRGDLAAHRLVVDDLAKGLTMARLASLEVTGADIQGQQQITVRRLRAADLQALEQPAAVGENPLPFLACRELTATGMGVSGGQVNAEQMELSGLAVRLVRDEEGQIDLRPWLPAAGQSAAGGGRKIGFRIGRIDLREGKLLFIDRSLQPAGRLEITPLRAHLENLDSRGGKSAAFDVELQMNGHAFSLRGRGEPFAPEPTTQLHLQTSGFPLTPVLPYLPADQIRAEAGLLDLNGDLELHYRPADQRLQVDYAGVAGVRKFRGATGKVRLAEVNMGWNGRLQMDASKVKAVPPTLSARGRLHAGPLQIATEGLDLRLGRLQVEENFAYGGDVPAGAEFRLEGKAVLHDLRVDDRTKKTNMLQLAVLEVTGASLQGPERIAIERVRAAGMQALQPPAGRNRGSKPAEHLISAAELVMERLAIPRPRQINISGMRLNGLKARVLRQHDGKLQILTLLANGAEEKSQPQSSETDGRTYAFKIESFELGDQTKLTFIDRSVFPVVRLNLALAARASAIDSAAPGQPTPVKMEGRFGKYTTIRLNGTVQPFAPQPTTDLRLELKDFSLPDVSAYAKHFIGYKVKSGNLDLQADVRIRQGKLDSKARIRLAKLDLKPLTAEEKSSATRELGFPLNAGLSMLRDRHGVIELTLPVTGDLQNPHIGLSGIIRKAFFKAVRSTVLGYFSPLGAVATLGEKLLFHRFHLRFKPIEFPPGQAQLSPAARQYLQKTAEKLKNRPHVTLTICGIAVPEDLQALPVPKEAGGLQQKADAENSNQQVMGRALALARRRSAAVQAALIGLGIDREQLAVCAPEMDENPRDKPRVELGI